MDPSLLSGIQQLGDLELAALTCLLAEHHCIITTEQASVDQVADSLQQSAHETFGLSCAVVDCGPGTTLNDFREGVLVAGQDGYEDASEPVYTHQKMPSFSHIPREKDYQPDIISPNQLDERVVANVVIAKNLSHADQYVQVQALELIRTKRLFSQTAMHPASRIFLFIALNATEHRVRLPKHLNDLFAICHQAELDDLDDAASFSSLRRKGSTNSYPYAEDPVRLHQPSILDMRKLVGQVNMTAEVAEYLHNIVIFMRRHRYVHRGVTAQATLHLRATVNALAVLHGLTFVTPSLVVLGVRKTYLHRLVLATPETEKSLQWGSDPAAIAELMRDVTVESAIDEIVSTVEMPL